MLRLAYSLVFLLATPLIVLRLLWRGIRQRGYWHHWGERWAVYSGPQPNNTADMIWLHAVSVGEVRATQPLVKRLQSTFGERPILITCMTPTGRDTARELYGDTVACVYLPYDFFTLHRRFIAHFRPAILLILETEIWPNLLAACRATNVPALLINARLSEKSRRGYVRFAPIRALARDAVRTLRAVAAQSTVDAERLATLGAADIVVTGNLKFERPVDSALAAAGVNWRKHLPAQKRVLLATSTRNGEEALLLDAYGSVFSANDRRDTLLVLVPRHPQRFATVYALIRDRRFTAGRRSEGERVPDNCEVWIGDSMGEMAAYIAMCDVAFIGGSLLPLGGQNLIEVCAQGKPVLMGPSIFNFAEAARLAMDAGAMRQCADACDVMRYAKVLLQDEARRLAMSQAAFEFTRAHVGATEKTMGLIAPWLFPSH